MQADLTTQIRATLDAWAQPSGIIEFPEPLTEAQYADLVARFKAAQLRPNEVKVIELPPSPFDRLRDALEAVLELHKAEGIGLALGPYCDVCVGGYEGVHEWPCPTVLAIAGKLGIEAHDD